MSNYEELIYTNAKGESLIFSATSITHCNVAKDVTGISDVKNSIYTSNSMNQYGESYLGQTFESREIEIVGNINSRDKDTILSTRRIMQKILNPQLSGKLIYIYGDYVKVIDCKIEDSPTFSNNFIFKKFAITFICLDPFWREENELREDIATWIGSLEFELQIDQDDGMEFGYRTPSIIINVYNDGDIETDMRVVFKAGGTLENPEILNVNTGEFIKINTTMEYGDVIEVNTKYGEKGATLTRDGVSENYFRYVDVDSTFMQLAIGDNYLRYDASSNIDALEVTIYHNDKYLGV